MGWVNKVCVAAVAMGACACGAEPDVGDELASTSDTGGEALGSTQQAIINNLAERSVAAAQLRINGDLQEWVFACDKVGWLRHRVRYGDGTWGAWRNHGHLCSGPPTVAVYLDAAGNELPVAYYRMGLNLKETVWTSSSSSSTVDLTQYLGDFTIRSEPVVSYYDKSNGDVSVLVMNFARRELVSLDWYDGSWHDTVVTAEVPDRLQVFFSSRTAPKAFFSIHTGHESVAYKRTSPAAPYTVVGTYPNVLSFGGLYESCRSLGCLMTWYVTGELNWGLMKSTQPAYTLNMWQPISSGPSIRAGGDPGQSYMVGSDGSNYNYRPNKQLLGLHTYYLEQSGTGGDAPAIPTCEPSLVTNVYAGSRYEKDAFIAVGEGLNKLTHVYDSGYLNPSLDTADLGLEIKLSTN